MKTTKKHGSRFTKDQLYDNTYYRHITGSKSDVTLSLSKKQVKKKYPGLTKSQAFHTALIMLEDKCSLEEAFSKFQIIRESN